MTFTSIMNAWTTLVEGNQAAFIIAGLILGVGFMSALFYDEESIFLQGLSCCTGAMVGAMMGMIVFVAFPIILVLCLAVGVMLAFNRLIATLMKKRDRRKMKEERKWGR